MPATLPTITPDQLCVGLYVHLDLSWWEHDFAFSTSRSRTKRRFAPYVR